MQLTVSRRLLLLGVISVVQVAAVGIAAVVNITSATELARYAEAVRASVELDMFHDAVRSDVYAALLSSAGVVDAEGDFPGHELELRDRLDRIVELLPDDAEVVAAVREVQPVLDAYLAAGGGVVEASASTATVDDGDVATFDEAFVALEGQLSSLSDRVAEASTDAEASNAAATAGARRVVLGLTLVVMASCVAGVVVISRSITGRLRAAVSRTLSAVGLLSVNGDRLRESARSTEQEAMASAGSAQAVSANMDAVAAATEEMSASIAHIAGNADDANRIAMQAVGVVESTAASITRLGESSAEVGQVVELIASIAGKTNLLALNATIEAARAGEAGQGFSVVANEVKDLALQTTSATAEIAERIAAIQRGAQDAVDAIAEVTRIIGSIAEVQSAIATAVDQQTAATTEISRNAQEAAMGTGSIVEAATQVADAAQANARAVDETNDAVQELASVAAVLRALVDGTEAGDPPRPPAGARPVRTFDEELALL